MTRNLKLENIILIFSQHLEYSHGTATLEKKLNVAVDFMMRVTDDEQSVEIFSAALKVWKWNKSEWTRCSLRSLVRQSFWSDITKWTLWCCVLCFFMGYLVDLGFWKGSSRKQLYNVGAERHQNKCCLSLLVAMLVDLSPPHLNYRLNYTTTTEWIVRKLSTDSDAVGWIQQTLEICWWVSSTTTARFVILREIGWMVIKFKSVNSSSSAIIRSKWSSVHLQHLQHSHQPQLNLSNAN